MIVSTERYKVYSLGLTQEEITERLKPYHLLLESDFYGSLEQAEAFLILMSEELFHEWLTKKEKKKEEKTKKLF